MTTSSDAADTIERVLAPYLGANMARAAVRGHVSRLGLGGATLRAGDIERLLAALAPGLGVFVGRDKTERVLAEVRAALAAPGGVE